MGNARAGMLLFSTEYSISGDRLTAVATATNQSINSTGAF